MYKLCLSSTFLFHLNPQPVAWCHPCSGQIFPTCLLTHMPIFGSTLTDALEGSSTNFLGVLNPVKLTTKINQDVYHAMIFKAMIFLSFLPTFPVSNIWTGTLECAQHFKGGSPLLFQNSKKHHFYPAPVTLTIPSDININCHTFMEDPHPQSPPFQCPGLMLLNHMHGLACWVKTLNHSQSLSYLFQEAFHLLSQAKMG